MTLDSQTYQALVSTRVEQPLSDDERAALVKRLSDDGILSENQAEWLVRRHGQQQSAQEIADALGVTRSRAYNLGEETSAKLTRIDTTLDGISDLREYVRPAPTAQSHPEPLADKEHWVVDGGTLHAPGPNGVSPCGHNGDRATHYRQLPGTRDDYDICDDCRGALLDD
jgi:hypothetical protein